jgi:hypothetical protein
MAVVVQPEQQPAPAAARRPAAAARPMLALLVSVLSLALALRLWGIGWGLPWAFHPDENFYADEALEMLKYGDPDPRYFKNPSLLTYLIAGELLLARALGPVAAGFAPSTPGAANLLARLDAAVLGAASVAILFALGSALFCRRVGLLAALFLAVAFLHVRDSHYGVNDVPGTALLLLSLYCDARLLREPALRWYALAGLAGGLATSTKYNMGFFFVPLLAAHGLAGRERESGGAGERKSGRHAGSPIPLSLHRSICASLRPLGLGAAASVVGYLAGTPFTVLDLPRFLQDFQTQYRFGNLAWLGQPTDPVPLQYVTALLQGFGAIPLALTMLGLAFAWRTRRPAAILLLAFPLAYLAFLLPKALFFPRFTIPLLPACCLLAAFGVSEAAGRLHPAWRPAGLAALLAAALAQPLAFDLLHNRILMETDTRILANEWVQTNVPPNSRLKIEDYSLRDPSKGTRTYTPNTAQLKIERFEGSPEADSARYFAEHNAQYVVTSSFTYERYLLNAPRPEQQESAILYQRLHHSLEQRTELVAQFSPGVGGSEVPFRLDDLMTPFWSLEQYERPGPTIRIYSLAPLGTAPIQTGG